jgi:hypothetical protein
VRLGSLALLTCACATAQAASPPEPPPGTVIGTYEELDMRMKPKPPPLHLGHVGIRRDDGSLVFLEPPWSKQAIRAPDERRTLAGKRVAATGTFHARCPEPKEPMALPIGPCLSPVENVTTR